MSRNYCIPSQFRPSQILCLYVGEQRSGDRDMPVAFSSGNGAYRDRDCCLPKQRARRFFLRFFAIFFNVTIFSSNQAHRYRDQGNATGSPLP
jgi:hypothetical protein